MYGRGNLYTNVEALSHKHMYFSEKKKRVQTSFNKDDAQQETIEKKPQK